MAIRYKIKPEGNLLVVKTSGVDESLEEVEQYGMAVIKACLEGNYSRVLCDEVDLEYRLAPFDTYRSAEFIASQAPKVGRVALVCNEKFFTDARFWETVAVNRGLTVRVFKDVEAARQWLDSV